MNARQKAKKYKRMYEALVQFHVEQHKIDRQFHVEQQKIDRLKFERYYPIALVTPEKRDFFREVITRDVAQSLADSLEKYIDYDMEFCPHRNAYRFCGEIRVLEKKGEN